MKRKQYIDWLAVTFGGFGTVYGAYLLALHYNHGSVAIQPLNPDYFTLLYL